MSFAKVIFYSMAAYAVSGAGLMLAMALLFYRDSMPSYALFVINVGGVMGAIVGLVVGFMLLTVRWRAGDRVLRWTSDRHRLTGALCGGFGLLAVWGLQALFGNDAFTARTLRQLSILFLLSGLLGLMIAPRLLAKPPSRVNE